MITDSIADMFTRIRNANAKLHEKADMPMSKIKLEIAKLLKEEGFIANYKVIEDKKQGILRVYLKYTPEGKQVIQGIKKVSRPGLRVYRGYSDMPKVAGGIGMVIVSTPKGILADTQAKAQQVGGEILGYIW